MSTTNPFGKKGWTPERIKDLSGKTFVITGTTSGTGFEAARILLSKNAKVVMLNRNPTKAADTIAQLKQLLGNTIDLTNITMDLGDQDSVKKAAAEVLEKVDRIDEAKNILLDPNKTIAEVAYELGFEYPPYFSRLFKKKEGISPTEYREKYSLN